VPEIAAVILLALAVPALAGDRALRLLVHGREAASRASTLRLRASFSRWLFTPGILVAVVGIVVRHH
jgi:hypothetical protein